MYNGMRCEIENGLVRMSDVVKFVENDCGFVVEFVNQKFDLWSGIFADYHLYHLIDLATLWPASHAVSSYLLVRALHESLSREKLSHPTS